jgi:hypothetical protein
MAEPRPDFDPYAMLGVSSSASASEIKRAHRVLIRLAHPDLSLDPAAAERAKRLNVARDWLLGPRRQGLYDGARGVARAADTSPPASRRMPCDRGWKRSRERGALDVFVARCAHLSRRDVHHLLIARRRMGSAGADSMSRAFSVVRERGRATFAAAAAADAVEIVRSRRQVGPELAEVLTWTAFGLVSADVAPADAAILLGAWREAVDRPDPMLGARKFIAQARHAARTATIALVVAVEIGAVVAGIMMLVRLATGT